MENTACTRTWTEIQLDAIEFNYRSLRTLLKESTKFTGVVKADAYGHGAVPVVLRLQQCGCDYFAVATCVEAVELRQNGIKKPILVLGYTPPEMAEVLLEYDITQAVQTLELARQLSFEAVRSAKVLKVHLEVDSGMGRLGFICSRGRDPAAEMAEAMRLPGLYTEGIFTHFSAADTGDDEYTFSQYQCFIELVDDLEKKTGHRFAIRHCANSAVTLKFSTLQLDMVRPGLALYGVYPEKGVNPIRLKPALSLKTRVVQLKSNQDGDSISYGRTYTVAGAKTIAVLPIGYGDGLHRILSGSVEVLIRGKRAPQVGRICMDMCMADVTDIPGVQVGDEVTLIGCDGTECLPVEHMAEKAGTIPYEIFCSLSKRVPRVYI